MPGQSAAVRAVSLAGQPGLPRPHRPAASTLGGWRKAVAWAGILRTVVAAVLRRHRHPFRAARLVYRVVTGPTRAWTTPSAATRAWASRTWVAVAHRVFIDPALPGWPSRAFDLAIERELERLDPTGRSFALQTAIVAMTTRCALACEHCFEWDALGRSEALSREQLIDIVRALQRRGTAQLLLSGGEPLQRFEDLVAIVASAARESDVWILTSGLGLTAERASRLRRVGLTGIMVSLDHWDAADHDRFRGRRGAFDAATRAARLTGEAGLVLALSLCPTRTFVSEENLQRYARLSRSLGASFIQILEPKAVGHYAGQDVGLDRPRQIVLERFAAALNGDTSPDVPTVRYVDWSRRALGCAGAGDRYVYVDTEGRLHACPFCRTSGIRLAGNTMDAALASLRSAGCPAADQACPRGDYS
jgi:MoaA/NifB/PqqE/SkfB family radical SAM enzyme